ncbi:MAG: mechanosensitive ion channel family protein, partial [Pseudomonadota bacterium]
MKELLTAFSEIQNDIPWTNLLLGFLVLAIGQIFFLCTRFVIRLFFPKKTDLKKHHNFRKFLQYTYYILIFGLFLKVLRVDLKFVLGATGLLTIAIGFAARTPISNLISGIFLVFERPFVIGDVISVNEIRGEVISLNLLSITLRTLDNEMVRLPNEVVIGKPVSNISFFPIRRLTIQYSLSQEESLTRLQETFLKVAERNELALEEPRPYFRVESFNEQAILVHFYVWASSDDYLTFQSEFPKEIHRA